MTRTRNLILGGIAGLTLLTPLALAGAEPAQAHHTTVTCNAPGKWKIVNSEPDKAMTYTTSAGHSGSIAAGGSTVVDHNGNTLTVHAVWPVNGAKSTDSGQGDCTIPTTTTTTTVPPATTAPPETTTTTTEPAPPTTTDIDTPPTVPPATTPPVDYRPRAVADIDCGTIAATVDNDHDRARVVITWTVDGVDVLTVTLLPGQTSTLERTFPEDTGVHTVQADVNGQAFGWTIGSDCHTPATPVEPTPQPVQPGPGAQSQTVTPAAPVAALPETR